MRSARATRSVRAVLRPLGMSLELLLMLLFMLLFVLSLRSLPFWSRIGASAGIVVLGVVIVEPIGAVVPVVALEPVAPVVPWVVTVVPFVPGCIVALFGSTRALSGVGTVVWA